MILFIRGKLRPESKNPISRITQAIYLPVLRLCLRYRKTTLLLNLVFLLVTLPLALKIGSQFMPPLFEGSALYMPTALPGFPSHKLRSCSRNKTAYPFLSGSRDGFRHHRTFRQRHGTTPPSTCTTRPSCSNRVSNGVRA